MTIGAIGGCTDNTANVLRPDKAQKPGEARPNPIEEANRLAEKTNDLDTSGIRDQRVNPTEGAARVGQAQNLALAAQVNELREGGGVQSDEPAGEPSNAQGYQSAGAADPKFPNRGGVLDFQV